MVWQSLIKVSYKLILIRNVGCSKIQLELNPKQK